MCVLRASFFPFPIFFAITNARRISRNFHGIVVLPLIYLLLHIIISKEKTLIKTIATKAVCVFCAHTQPETNSNSHILDMCMYLLIYIHTHCYSYTLTATVTHPLLQYNDLALRTSLALASPPPLPLPLTLLWHDNLALN